MPHPRHDNTEPIPADDDGLPRYTEPPPRPTESNIARHAWDELDRAGLFTADGDFYGGMLGRAVLELVEVFAAQGHSGMSAGIVTDMFGKLARFKALSDLTSDPSEWIEVGPGVWQSRRQADAFSRDGGKTWRRNGDPRHEMIVSHEHDGARYVPVCNEPPDADCQLACSQGCVEWETLRDDAGPFHLAPTFGTPVVRHDLVPGGGCQAVGWLLDDYGVAEADVEQAVFEVGRFPIDVVPTDDGYGWKRA